MNYHQHIIVDRFHDQYNWGLRKIESWCKDNIGELDRDWSYFYNHSRDQTNSYSHNALVLSRYFMMTFEFTTEESRSWFRLRYADICCAFDDARIGIGAVP